MYGAVFSGLKRISRALVFVLCLFPGAYSAEAGDAFLALCYHDIPPAASTPEDVPRHVFVQQLEYLKTHGYTVISPDDITAARQRLRPLPDKAVLLTFYDSYRSFYDFVYPVLRLYGYPAVLSVVTSWIGQRPDYIGDKDLSHGIRSKKWCRRVSFTPPPIPMTCTGALLPIPQEMKRLPLPPTSTGRAKTEGADRAADIDLTEARIEKDRLEKLMAEKLSERDYEKAQVDLLRTSIRIQVAEKHGQQ